MVDPTPVESARPAHATPSVPSNEPRLPADELPVGQEISCGSHEVTEDELIAFATDWDPQYFHVDREQAAQSDFGGLITSGLHTASILQRLAVAGVYGKYDVIAAREITSLRFLRPVRAGDVLTCSILIESVTPDRPGRSLVTMLGTLRNQHDRPVLEMRTDSLIRSRR